MVEHHGVLVVAPLLLCWGTRPDAIKLGPVAAALDAAGTPWSGLCSGQHTDLLKGTPAETDLRRSTSLGLASTGNVLRWLATAERAYKKWFKAEGAETQIVVVQGDTMSALAAARAALEGGRLVCHVEAGLRSGDKNNPWPEEETRVELTRLADWHYAPTSKAFGNLMTEGVSLGRIRLTGNTVVSALARYTTAKPSPSKGHLLVTLHRREWLQGPAFKETIEALLQGVSELNVEVFWPVHPAVFAAAGPLFSQVPKNLFLVAPLPYGDAARLLATAHGVITDSGGIQEEAATLGVPAAVMRFVTDRPESVEAGVALLFPPTASGMKDALACVNSGALPRMPVNVFGGPEAAFEVAAHLSQLAQTG